MEPISNVSLVAEKPFSGFPGPHRFDFSVAYLSNTSPTRIDVVSGDGDKS